MKLTLKIYLMLCALWLTQAVAAAESVLGSDLSGLQEYAREHNPDLAAMRLEMVAAEERSYAADAWPDPVLRTELNDITNQGNTAPRLAPSQVGSASYQVMQAVPIWGKRGLKREVAEAEAQQALGRSNLTWTELSARIKKTYAQYYLYNRSEKLTQEVLALLNNLEQISQSRYATGLAAQQDVIRAQVEQTALRRELVMLNTDLHHAMTRINTLLKRDASAPLAEPHQLRPLPAVDKLAIDKLAQRQLLNNPQLFSLDAQITAADKSRDLVLKNRYPDFTVGLTPTQRGSQIKEWGLMLEMNIPLQQGARRSQEREAQAQLAAAHMRKAAAANQLAGDLSENLLAFNAAQQIESLSANSLLPQAEATFQAALVGYQNGQVDFATLLDSQRQILKAKLDVLNAQADAQIRLAEIEKLIGEEL